MSNLYNNDLFHHTLNINRKSYKIVIQFYVQLSNGVNCQIMLAKTGDKKENKETDEFCLLSMNTNNNEIIPIQNSYFKDIVNLILRLDIDEFIKLLLRNIYDDIRLENAEGIIKIHNNLSVIIGNSKKQNQRNNITIKLIKENSIIPTEFCFFTSDGLNSNVYIEIDNIIYESYKSYRMLNGIQIYMGTSEIGTFLAYDLVKMDNKLRLKCKTHENMLLQEKNIQSCQFINCNFYETSYFLMLMSGIKEEKINLPDEYRKTYNWYTVIVPIDDLSIDDEFGVGNVRFLKEDNKDVKLLEENVKKCGDITKCYAKVYVNEYSFYKAYIKAKMQINQALDFIINLARDDSLFSNHSIKGTIIGKTTMFFNAKPVVDFWCYIENSFENKKIIFNSRLLFSNSNMKIDINILKALEDSEKFELYLIGLAEDENSEIILPLFNALKWVRKAWDSNDSDDQIIYSIIALEFIVSGEPKSPLLNKSKKRKVKKQIEESLKTICSDSENIESLIEDINKKFDFACSDTPFFVKLQNLIERLNIHISDDDIELIKAARGKRNDIVHGRKSENLSVNEIKRLCEIIGLIAFSKIDSLEVKQ